MNLQSYLDEMGVHYHLTQHPTAYTAQDLAHAEHVSGRRVLKPVVVEADGQFVLCALPACHKIDLAELRDQLEAQNVRLVDESRLRDIFPDCELGAEPPIGRIYGMPTIMDESVLQDDRVTFQAGRHDAAVTMSVADYRRLAQPEIAHFGRQMM